MTRATFPCKPRFIASPLLPSTCYQVTGNVSGVRTIGIVRHCRDASTNRKVGKRDTHISSTTSASRRPSCAPRQYLKPLPNVRCGLVVALVKRVISKRSGSGYTSGSRLAAQGQQRPVRLYADVCPASQCPIRQPPLPHPLGCSARGWSTNCLSPLFRPRLSRRKMCWICICIEGTRETVLADEDSEQATSRWCSHAGGETGILADPLAMDVESSSGTRTAPLSHSHANDRIRSSARSLAGSPCRADGRGPASFHSGVWPCAMGTPFVDFRLSRICFYASTRWKPALSRQSSSLSTRTQARARWLVSSFVCRSHPRLSRLSPACPVSRKQFHQQTTTGECGVLASLSPRSGFCCSCFKWG
jgi:hypothetical protein